MARPPSTRERLVASAAVAGGALITIGAFLPWLTLFAGLHPLRGVIGLNGRVLAAGGAVCLVVGIRGWRRPAPGLERAVAALGWACAGFAIWLTVQLFITYRELRADPMLVPRLGPGLFLALIGSLLPAATAMLRLRSWRAPPPGSCSIPRVGSERLPTSLENACAASLNGSFGYLRRPPRGPHSGHG